MIDSFPYNVHFSDDIGKMIIIKVFCPTQHSHAKVAVFLGINWCGTFPLLSAPHSLFRILKDLKILETSHGRPKVEMKRVDLAKLGPTDFIEIDHRG